MQGAWIIECLEHMKKNSYTRIEPMQDAEDRWVAFTHEKFADLLWGQQTGDEAVEMSRNFTECIGVPQKMPGECRERL
jgi:hypothetical protein